MNKKILMCLVMLAQVFVSCGFSGNRGLLPAIMSLADAAGNLIAVTGTNVSVNNAGSFTVTFSHSMSTSALTAGNITFACDGAPIVVDTTEQNVAYHIYTITPASVPSGGGSCVLTFTANLKDIEGTALPVTSYTMTLVAVSESAAKEGVVDGENETTNSETD